ncbi:hypothetical protein FGO68_gene7547 [Halteria grandinella]|uniref:Uncharacterized protein n=1 Tax=Halteria grandinella TaxID=5974 RepID=A0A8J8T8M5_HALGN|nr:hypothetical protein FGO68_gene7547 [Halteria grandinella]
MWIIVKLTYISLQGIVKSISQNLSGFYHKSNLMAGGLKRRIMFTELTKFLAYILTRDITRVKVKVLTINITLNYHFLVNPPV